MSENLRHNKAWKEKEKHYKELSQNYFIEVCNWKTGIHNVPILLSMRKGAGISHGVCRACQEKLLKDFKEIS